MDLATLLSAFIFWALAFKSGDATGLKNLADGDVGLAIVSGGGFLAVSTLIWLGNVSEDFVGVLFSLVVEDAGLGALS